MSPLRELRTPELLIEVSTRFPDSHRQAVTERPLIACVPDEDRLREGLGAEERAERAADRAYWAHLRAELEQLRRARRRRPDPDA